MTPIERALIRSRLEHERFVRHLKGCRFCAARLCPTGRELERDADASGNCLTDLELAALEEDVRAVGAG